MFYIYAYLRTVELTPYYIGKGHGYRAWNNKHSVVVPKDKNRIVIMESNLTEIGAFALERRMIQWYGRKDLGTGILRNRTNGGDGSHGIIPWNKGKKTGSYLTEAGRRKMSKANKGISKPKGHGDKVSKALKGKPKSEAHKRKLSEAGMGKTPWNKGKKGVQVAWNKGVSPSDETRQKMGDSHRGVPNTPEQKAKISKTLKGRVMSKETRNKMSESRKLYWAKRKQEGDNK